MKCAKCGAAAIVRQGKFGAFYCCPNSRQGDNHGTRAVAVQNEIEKIVANARHNDSAPPSPPDLEKIVRTGMVTLAGVHMSDVDLFVDLFVEGNWRDADIFDGGPFDDSDHWSNQRPY